MQSQKTLEERLKSLIIHLKSPEKILYYMSYLVSISQFCHLHVSSSTTSSCLFLGINLTWIPIVWFQHYLLHEYIHNNVFPYEHTNRRIGFLFSLVTGLPCFEILRSIHIKHHLEQGTSNDPYNTTNTFEMIKSIMKTSFDVKINIIVQFIIDCVICYYFGLFSLLQLITINIIGFMTINMYHIYQFKDLSIIKMKPSILKNHYQNPHIPMIKLHTLNYVICVEE
jgi:fatty acid desaturase